MMKHVNIGIAVQSPIIFTGLSAVIKGTADCGVTIIDVSSQNLMQLIAMRSINILIVDPITTSAEEITELKASANGRIKIAAIYHSALPQQLVKVFDEMISVYDGHPSLKETIRRLTSPPASSPTQRDLTQREQEIVKCVVRGMSNKEIANRINLSVNTVMTHRRNIAAKLQIHSPAGLTIYALVSKLVKLDEISNTLG